ncbi:hypothetical protein K435DRAFT_885292 [Dendrothele bispora CBS 962.96]|uniref:C2H2-type domain-containing protein n=1 Tax=Dendrothele bispora (strain CBS 962.96) TaxID=1314807 RepID=A0A4S8M821_DENBC|nr:hypothetical protein K435DRAFT_885292 [Dendrothele bispora CBS 962.96]
MKNYNQNLIYNSNAVTSQVPGEIPTQSMFTSSNPIVIPDAESSSSSTSSQSVSNESNTSGSSSSESGSDSDSAKTGNSTSIESALLETIEPKTQEPHTILPTRNFAIGHDTSRLYTRVAKRGKVVPTIEDLPWQCYVGKSPTRVLDWILDQKRLGSSVERPDPEIGDETFGGFEDVFDEGDSNVLNSGSEENETEMNEQTQLEHVSWGDYPYQIQVDLREETEIDQQQHEPEPQTPSPRRKRRLADSEDEDDEYTPFLKLSRRPNKRLRTEVNQSPSKSSTPATPTSSPHHRSPQGPRNIQHPNPAQLLEDLSDPFIVDSWRECPLAYLGCTQPRGRSMAEFRRHVKSHAYDVGSPEWTCENCGTKLSRKDALRRHIRENKCEKVLKRMRLRGEEK